MLSIYLPVNVSFGKPWILSPLKVFLTSLLVSSKRTFPMSWVVLFKFGETTTAEEMSLVKFLEIDFDEVGNFVLPDDPLDVDTEVSKN